MEIKVTFRFDASDSLLACVDNFRKAMEALTASGGLSVLPTNKEAGIVKAVATEEGVTVNKKERIWPPVEETAEKPVETAEAPEAEQPKAPTIADMRAANDRARTRIEGEGWESKDTEGYRKYHKKVTAAIKGIVAFCGAEKMPDIPEERRKDFIAQVDDLELDGDEVKPSKPF